MPANLPYPLQFDPSQMKNPYTKWAGVAMPWHGLTIDSSGTYGNQVPTDAMGNPIQSYVDANNTAQSNYQTQLAAYNAQQQAAAAQPAAASTSSAPNVYGTANPDLSRGIYSAAPAGGYGSTMASAADPSQYSAATQSAMSQYPGGIPLSAFAGGTGGGNQNQQDAAGLAALMGLNPQNLNGMGAVYNNAPAAAAPAKPPPPTPPNMTQTYIAALQRPGQVTTPGANVPEALPPSTQSNVLQQFLANWQQGGGNTKGAGNYNNKGFFDALSGNV